MSTLFIGTVKNMDQGFCIWLDILKCNPEKFIKHIFYLFSSAVM